MWYNIYVNLNEASGLYSHNIVFFVLKRRKFMSLKSRLKENQTEGDVKEDVKKSLSEE